MLHFCRTLFLNTNNIGFCTLRAELLMALHDNGVAQIYNKDPCHKLAWCLDACIRDDVLEEWRISEIVQCLKENSDKPVLGDLALIIRDPFATNTILRAIFGRLVNVVKREDLPYQDEPLKHLTKLLVLGIQAKTLIQQKNFLRPKSDKRILQKFYPSLALLILDNEDSGTIIAPLDAKVTQLFKESIVARKVMLYYCITRIQAKDQQSVKYLLEAISDSVGEQLLEEPDFIQSAITELEVTKKPHPLYNIIIEFLMNFKNDSFAQAQLRRAVHHHHYKPTA